MLAEDQDMLSENAELFVVKLSVLLDKWQKEKSKTILNQRREQEGDNDKKKN